MSKSLAKGGKATPLEILEQCELLADLHGKYTFQNKLLITGPPDPLGIHSYKRIHPTGDYEAIDRGQAEKLMEEIVGLQQAVVDPDPYWTGRESMNWLGYEQVRDDGEYAKYVNCAGQDLKGYGPAAKGKRIIYFNRGYAPAEGVFVGIEEDGGTRSVFNGVIHNGEFLRQILNAVR
jgi:hypothetical protein